MFSLKVSEDDSVLVGNDRIWIWGLLAYSTKFDTWNSTLISQDCKDEARHKSLAVNATPLSRAVQECYNLVPIGKFNPFEQSFNHIVLTKQIFWVKSLETCILTTWLQALRLDTIASCTLESILHLYYHGFIYTFSWNPLLALQLLDDVRDRIDQELHGDSFWTFNPVLLVQSYLWTSDLSALFSVYIKNFHPTRHIPLSTELLQAANPVPPLKPVDEQSASDQDSACALALGTQFISPLLGLMHYVVTRNEGMREGFLIE